MAKIAQLVLGPAGAGKSTYCAALQEYLQTTGDKRGCHIINLDPAAESFEYTATVDIRELITVQDVMEYTDLGPNGGLVYAMEYVLTEDEWFDDMLGDYEDDYLVFDCPGQVELYTHYPVFTLLAEKLRLQGYRVICIYLVEASKISIPTILDSTCAQAALGLPQLNVASKADLVPGLDAEDIESMYMRSGYNAYGRARPLIDALVEFIDTHTTPTFEILDISKDESIGFILDKIDVITQYDEDAEPREPPDIDQYDEYDQCADVFTGPDDPDDECEQVD